MEAYKYTQKESWAAKYISMLQALLLCMQVPDSVKWNPSGWQSTNKTCSPLPWIILLLSGCVYLRHAVLFLTFISWTVIPWPHYCTIIDLIPVLKGHHRDEVLTRTVMQRILIRAAPCCQGNWECLQKLGDRDAGKAGFKWEMGTCMQRWEFLFRGASEKCPTSL